RLRLGLPPPACGGGLGWGLTAAAEAVGFGFAQRAAAAGGPGQQGRGRPALAIALMPGGDLVVDLAHADRVGPIHQPAAIAREAEAVEPHDIDIAGAERLALIEDLARLVDRREQQPLQDLLVGEVVLRDTQLGDGLLDDARDLRVGMRRAVARLVAIPALAGFLAAAAGFDDTVGDRRTAVVRVLGLPPLARVIVEVDPGHSRHDT